MAAPKNVLRYLRAPPSTFAFIDNAYICLSKSASTASLSGLNEETLPPGGGNTCDRSLVMVDPATGLHVADVPAAGVDVVDRAVKAAQRAWYPAEQPATGPSVGWRFSTGHERHSILTRLGELILGDRERLARIESLTMGKPIEAARHDVDETAATFASYGRLSQHCFADSHAHCAMDAGPGAAPDFGNAFRAAVGAPWMADMEGFLSQGAFRARILSESVGVVGQVLPWNFPLTTAAWKIAPALAAGCSIVVKPSEYSPFSLLELVGLAAKAGLPPGVLNVVIGEQATGSALVNHAGLNKISFTGSGRTGSIVASDAAKNLIPCTMELGGKSPIVVFDDVDIDKAAQTVLDGFVFNTGQVCTATTRLIVQDTIRDRFVARLAELAAQVQTIHPLEVPAAGAPKQTRIGPVVCRKQVDFIRAPIEADMKTGHSSIIFPPLPSTEGTPLDQWHALCRSGHISFEQTERPAREATLLAWDIAEDFDPASPATAAPEPLPLADGNFVRPVIVQVNCTQSSRIWKQEVFGPVLAVASFSDEQHALALAHDTEFGLGAAILSGVSDGQSQLLPGLEQVACADRQRRLARIDYMVRNLRSGYVWVQNSQTAPVFLPFGGVLHSGYGRELSIHGLQSYLVEKSVLEAVGRAD